MISKRLGTIWIAACVLYGCSGPAPATEPAQPSVEPSAEQSPEQSAEPKPSKSVEQAALEAPTMVAALGSLAPDFTLPGVDGKTYELSKLKGKLVVLEWFNPDCPFVKHAHTQGPLATMAKRVKGPDIVWLSINSGGVGKQGHGAERNAAAVSEYGLENPILLDESGAVGRAYGAVKTPHMFIVNEAGVLVYRGGIDNAPIGKVDVARPRLPTSKEDELVNYVDAALEDLRAKRALRLADTPPYGCTVKYKS